MATLTLYSWRGISFQAAGFDPKRAERQAVVPAAVMLSVERSGLWGQPVGKQFPAQTYSFFLQWEIPQRDEAISDLEQWFDPTDNTWGELIATDGTNLWAMWGTVLSVVEQGLNTAVINIAVREPFWIRKTPNNTSWSITGTGQTKQVTVNKTFARPKFTITPTTGKTSQLAYRRFVGLYNVATTDWGVLPIDIMNASWDTATLVSGGKMQTSGYDVEVYVDGVKVPRWIGAPNTATSRLWVNLNLPKYLGFKLATSIASSGSITEIVVKRKVGGKDYLNDLKLMPQAGIVKIDNEYFTYTACVSGKLKFQGVTRAAKLSSMASHSVDANVIFIPHDIWVAYGNTSASAPVQDETLKPMFYLNTSTNSLLNYPSTFTTVDGTGKGLWRPIVYKQSFKGTNYYADDHGGPPTDNFYYYMGMEIVSMFVNNGWKAETGAVGWTFYHPATIRYVEAPVGGMSRYRYSSAWPPAKLQYSFDGRGWRDLYTIGSPSYPNNWQVFSIPIQTVPYAKYLRFVFSGTVPALANNLARLQVNSFSVTLDTNMMPNIAVSAEAGGYVIDADITLLETGEKLSLYVLTQLNVAIVVDCANHTVVRAEDNTPLNAAVFLTPPRAEWFRMNKGPTSGVNTFQWDEVGVVAVTVGIDTYEMQYAK